MTVWWLLVAVIIVSWGLTLVLRRYALYKSLIDIPNERSSHSVPTPRGGGIAIVASFCLALPILAMLGLISPAATYGLLGSGLLVAAIGFVDDHGHIAARWRLFGHFLAASWGLFWFNGLPTIELFGVGFSLGWAGNIFAAIYIVWMLNLYNFMDGIDGLASAEAVSVCLSMCLLYWLSEHTEYMWVSLLLAASVTGFLRWNFPPARIFMGDAGSGFLGIALAFLSIHAAWTDSQLIWCWIILLGVFIVDATFTLIKRLLKGQKIYQAHRSHAYQVASRTHGSHKIITVAVVVINFFGCCRYHQLSH